MSNPTKATQPTVKASKLPLLLGLGLGLIGAGGGFAATYLGAVDSVVAQLFGASATEQTTTGPSVWSHITFVPMEPVTINLGPRSDSRHLRFVGQLEVPNEHAAEVQRLMPRILDVVNIYLRALEPHEIEEPSALLNLRHHMLRRIRVVAGPGAVNDLLIIEFIMN